MKRKPSIPSEGIVEPHHLAELVDFEPNQGIIRLHEQRVVLLSAAAMGLMRKEVIDTFGLETARLCSCALATRMGTTMR
jgi:two-component system response regulator HydG